MFKLTTNPTFKHTVAAMVPINGGHRRETFSATYNVLETDHPALGSLDTHEGTTAFLHAAIERLDDIADENGDPLEWNDDVRDQVLRLPYARIALISGYFEGIAKAKKGN